MNLFFSYFLLQLKRLLKSFPSIFFTTVLLVLAIGSLFVVQLKIDSKNPEKQKYNIGLVGDLDETYLGFGIDAIEKIDSSRFILDFLEMKEEEAQAAIRNNTISGYIRIPDDFVNSLVHGKDTHVTFVCASSQNTLGTEIIKELAQSVSKIVMESQAALYTAYRVYDAETEETYEKDLKQLNIQYFDLILGRETIYQIETTGGRSGLSLAAYLFCSATIIFLLFFGISCSSILNQKDRALSELLAAHGLSPLKQCLGEFLSFTLFMNFNSTLILAVLFTFIKRKNLTLFPEAERASVFHMLPALWIIILCISALLYLLYNLSQSLYSGILLNFVLALFMGYFSGCFYPLSYFPIILQKICRFSPAAISMNVLTNSIKTGQLGKECIGLVLYTLLFLTIASIVRKSKLNK